jgi:hypothetical protein
MGDATLSGTMFLTVFANIFPALLTVFAAFPTTFPTAFAALPMPFTTLPTAFPTVLLTALAAFVTIELKRGNIAAFASGLPAFITYLKLETTISVVYDR